ncbi:MAG: LPS export ABC transporter periplasmic protein LptC [Bacteroidales bacterium]|nr:LPS export ABC transporter periplasmic protein LptC [Bacteroidales bacterium]
MRKLLSEQDNFSNRKYLKSIIIPALTGIIMLFGSCKRSNIEKINAITSELNAPSMAVTNTEIIYSKNALIEVKIISKQINRYADIEEPYTEFPEGLFVEFYDSTQTVTSSIKANYCIYDQTNKLWTAENDVVSISDEGDTLNTEFLIWDEKKGKIYSDTYVRITNSDGIIHGTGFEANQDLSDIKIKNTTGVISVENEN